MNTHRVFARLVLIAALLAAGTGIADTPGLPPIPQKIVPGTTTKGASGGPVVVVPATPTNFTNRINGTGSNGFGVSSGGSTGGLGLNTQPRSTEKTVRTTTYIALSDTRQWKSNDEKTLLGKLIAFENVVVEVKLAAGQQAQPAAPPPMPDKPTVVKDGKARLLIDNKPFEVPLERLSEDDQKFVNNIKAAIDAKKAK